MDDAFGNIIIIIIIIGLQFEFSKCKIIKISLLDYLSVSLLLPAVHGRPDIYARIVPEIFDYFVD